MQIAYLKLFIFGANQYDAPFGFLTGYIFEISFEYFSQFLGGSIALVLAGVLVMGMAYGATRFAKRFIVKPPKPPQT